MANNHQKAKRRVTIVSALIAIALYSLILLGPAIGGYVTAEQPASGYSADSE